MERIDEIGFGGLKLIQDTEMFCYGCLLYTSRCV